MKKLFIAFVVALAILVAGTILHPSRTTAQTIVSRVGHVWDASAYGQWGAQIAAGNSATGSQTITICPFFVNTPDGRKFSPFSTTVPITVDPHASASKETVTPSAVSQVAPPAGYQNPDQACASVTATFANTHGTTAGGVAQVISGDSGAAEAVLDAANGGGGLILPLLSTGSITPAATAAAIGTTGQAFTLTGAPAAANVTVVSQPAPTSLCPMVAARVTAANQVTLYFTTLSAAACTPAAGTYTFLSSR